MRMAAFGAHPLAEQLPDRRFSEPGRCRERAAGEDSQSAERTSGKKPPAPFAGLKAQEKTTGSSAAPLPPQPTGEQGQYDRGTLPETDV